MSVQTIVNQDPAIAVPGMEADNGPKDVASQVANEILPYGSFVCRVAGNENKCRLPLVAADITDSKVQLGIARENSSVESKDDGLVPNYSINKPVAVATSGRYYVLAEDEISVSDDVFVRYLNKSEIITINYDGDFITGDTIEISIDGAVVATPFNNDLATTYADISANLLTAFPTILSQVSDDSIARSVVITASINNTISVLTEITASGVSGTKDITQLGTSTLTRGQFRSDADAGNAVQWPQARYVKGALASGFAVVEINQ